MTATARSLTVLLVTLLTSVSAYAQAKVAVLDPNVVFSKLEERVALQSQFDERRKAAVAEGQNMAQELQALSQRRNSTLKAGTDQYKEETDNLMRKNVDLRVFGEMTQIREEREKKEMIKVLYDKIAAEVQLVAEEKSLDLVLTRVVPQVDMDAVTADQFGALLSAQNVLFVRPELDITQEVIQRINDKYKSQPK